MSVQVSYNCWDGSGDVLNQLFHDLAIIDGYERSEKGGIFFRGAPLPEETKQGIWQEIPNDPLDILLAFNGYDGHLEHKLMKPLADHLIELLPKIGYGRRRRATERFIDGLMDAHEAGTGITFY